MAKNSLPARNARNAAIGRLLKRQEQSLKESIDALNRLVDPREAFEGPNGELWEVPGGASNAHDRALSAQGVYRSEADLKIIRDIGRWLYDFNPFARNAIENRVNYVIGWGHSYAAAAKEGLDATEGLVQQVQDFVDEFCRVNRWGLRQQENVRRRDRDGECILRFFRREDGMTLVRFIQPEQLSNPSFVGVNDCVAFGIRTAPNDDETIECYYVQYKASEQHEEVPACDVQHRKRNVDLAVPRGVSSLYVVRNSLDRAVKILRNMGTVVQIQAAIAMIRRHVQGTSATVNSLVRTIADSSRTDPTTGKTTTQKKYPPGAIIDAPSNMEYEFPAQGADVSRIVAALQAELRATAAGLVMPEYMISADASNANYSSTLVAESPTVRQFERMQQDEIEYDLDVFRRAIKHAIEAGRLPAEALTQVKIQATAPNLTTRDPLQEEQCRQIRRADGVESIETSREAAGLDNATENARIAVEREMRTDQPALPSLDSFFGAGADKPTEPSSPIGEGLANAISFGGLNGEQTAAMLSILQSKLPPTAMISALETALPSLTPERIAALVEPLQAAAVIA